MSSSGFKPFGALAVVGLGLIGGSFARDVRRLGLAQQLIGYDINAAYRKEISSLNLVDYLAAAPDEKLAEAELVLLAVPVKAFAEVLTQIRPHLSASAIVTDAGSVKSPLLKIMSAPSMQKCALSADIQLQDQRISVQVPHRKSCFPENVLSLLQVKKQNRL